MLLKIVIIRATVAAVASTWVLSAVGVLSGRMTSWFYIAIAVILGLSVSPLRMLVMRTSSPLAAIE